MKKLLYIILDGLGDLPCEELNGKTPLEAAATPYLDRLAHSGITGLIYSVGKGIAPESDIAVISMLGYDPVQYYTGRGPLECYAEGLAVNDGDLAYRVNFATLGEGRKIVDRRVGRNLTTNEATLLGEEIDSKVKLTSIPATFEFKNTVGHRGVLVLRAKQGNLSAEVTNTDPAYGKEGVLGVAKPKYENILLECEPTPDAKGSKEAQAAAVLTNEFIQKSHEVLERSEVNQKRKKEGKLPANVILSRDGGDRLPKFPSLRDRFGMSFGCFVEMPVEKGIALLTGMEVIDLPLPTGNYEQDYPLRAALVLKTMKKFDSLYIHIKGPDEPAHDGKAKAKKQIIELIDKYFFGQLLPSLTLDKVIVTVTSDHSTPCSLKAHSDDPVPLLIAGGSVKPDGTKSFSERSCKSGSLGTMIGNQLIGKLAKLAQD